MSDPRTHTAPTAPDVERIVGVERRPSLIDASLTSARLINDTMTGVIQPQIDTHSTAIAAVQREVGGHGEAIAGITTKLDGQAVEIGKAQERLNGHDAAIAGATAKLDAQGADIGKAQGLIGTQGETIAGMKAQVHTHGETISGIQTHVINLTETTGRHEQALTFALLGEEGHIRRLGLEVAALGERVWRLEHPDRGHEPAPTGTATEQAREMHEANEALRERVTAMEDAIRQLLARGAQGGGPRSPRR